MGERHDNPGRVLRCAAPAALLALALAFDAGTSAAQFPSLGAYHALVIGNQTYRQLPQLTTPVADARAVADLLRRDYGFTGVHVLENATRAQMVRALDDLRRALGANDNLLVYYAGHGWLDREADRGYWLPVDAERDGRANWLSNADITDTLRALKAKHVLVVADSCYSGSLTRSIGVQPLGAPDILRLAQKKARTVLTSGGLEPVADVGGGGHSVFAKAFLDALRGNPGAADLASLFGGIRRQVLLNSQQTPEYADIRQAGHDGGDFIFARPGARLAAVPSAPAALPPEPAITKEVVKEYGTLAIRGRLAGIEVWLDDRKLGETETGTALVMSNLPAGTYRVKARKAGHKDWESQVQVAANQRAEVVIDIEPLRPAPPPVTDSRTFRLRAQSTFPNKSILHEGALRLASTVDDLSGGRFKIEVLPAGAVVPAFRLFDTVGQGTLDAGFAPASYWIGKFRWASLFSGVPFGLTAEETTAWLERGGGLALQRELYARHNVVPFPAGTTGDNMAGWSRKEIQNPNDLKGLKIRAVGVTIDLLRKVGAAVTALPGGEIVPALDRGVIDAAGFIGPFEDMLLGLHEIRGLFYYGPSGWLAPASATELIVNKRSWENLPPHLQQHLEDAARQTARWMLDEIRRRNGKVLAELTSVHGVRVRRLPDSVLAELRRASEETLEEYARADADFRRVYSSLQQFRAGYRR